MVCDMVFIVKKYEKECFLLKDTSKLVLSRSCKMSRKCNVVAIRHADKEDLGFGTMSWSLPAGLTSNGIHLACKTGRDLKDLLAGCRLFATSPLIRAQETLFHIMDAQGISAKDFDGLVLFEPGLWTSSTDIWYCDDAASYTNRRIWESNPPAVELDGASVLSAIKGIAQKLTDDEQNVALAVSHGGPLDACIMRARQELHDFRPITELGPCEGAIFSFRALWRDVLELTSVQEITRLTN